MRFDAFELMVDRAQLQIVLEVFEPRLDLRELEVELPEIRWISPTEIGAQLSSGPRAGARLAGWTKPASRSTSCAGAHGGVMTVQELALALLAAHGSAEKDDALRLRIAAAVVRACLEAEADLTQWRYQQFEHDPIPLVATSSDLADYAKRLARGADEMALAEPLLAPQRAAESLESVPRPEPVAPLVTQRLLRVGTATSKGAALSSRLEIYPRGMAASQAVRQSLGVLVGPRFLTAEQVVERVRGRYPEAEPLPWRPALDALLVAAGAPMTWSDTGDRGPAYYQAAESLGPSAGTTNALDPLRHRGSLPGEVTADIADARQFEEAAPRPPRPISPL